MALTSVPARLVYACGHAALVSLAAVKGETSRQRAERVQREKDAAQQRSCDFCAPVAMDAAVPLVEEVLANGHADAEPVMLELQPLEAEIAAVAEPRPLELEAETEPQPEVVSETQPERVTRRTTPRKARAPRAAVGTRFRITFVAEQVIQARTVVDALARAHARGASDVWSIVRLD